MSKASIVVDLAYKSPKRKGRGSGPQGLLSGLKYFQYREDRNTLASAEKQRDRWQDHGMGKHYREIASSCAQFQSRHVLAWSWVISPAPDLMVLVPEDQRRKLVMDVTERVVESYYEARGFQTPPYSFVLHDRLTIEGEQQLHTHVILPGMAPTIEGWEPVYNNKSQKHDELFNEIARQEFEAVIDQTIGPEWRRLRPEPQIQPVDDIPQDIDNLDAWFPR
jgi:hypothetical protein